jgi:hypothetical protein
MVLKKDIKNKTSKKNSLSVSSDKRGEMLIQIDSLMEKINNEYGPFILDELQKRLEFTIEEFHGDLKFVLDSAFIAEHQKKQKNKKK